ncbi:MAG: hypothetical protein QOG64_3270, partial [Acidimicrobiaceae bacterium]|nr:hypothetical protein [Acidimicrobiaceae bacterium]
MRRRSLGRRLGLAVSVVAPLLSLVVAQPSVVDAAPADITFGRPTFSGVQGLGYEQDLRRDDHDPDPTKSVIYTSVPASLSSGTSWIWRSKDNGATFKWVPAATPKEGKLVTACAGGGDTELATDTNGKLYFNDLTLANFSTARSSDQGTTLAPTTCAAVASSPDDRQWYAVDGDPTAPSDPTH